LKKLRTEKNIIQTIKGRPLEETLDLPARSPALRGEGRANPLTTETPFEKKINDRGSDCQMGAHEL
jgi:hypothetical protein